MERNILSKKAKDNIIFFDRVVIMSKEDVVEYVFFEGYIYIIFSNKSDNRKAKYFCGL
jgi:hypothetical protein